MWNELSGKQKGGLVGVAIVAALVLGFWIGRSVGTKEVKPIVQEPIELTSGSSGQKNDVEPEKAELIVVHVKGEVVSPGLYEMEDGSRVEDAIRVAGGALDSADWSSVNLAKILEDGDQVVLKPLENLSRQGDIQWPIRINEATLGELEQIPGIGPAMATDILRWRSEIGPIEGIQDLERIPGFGPETVRRILPYVRFD